MRESLENGSTPGSKNLCHRIWDTKKFRHKFRRVLDRMGVRKTYRMGDKSFKI